MDSLVTRCLSGDQLAATEIYYKYRPIVFGYSMKMLHDHYEAEENTQEAFIKIFQKLHTFRGDSKFGTWVYRVARNNLLERFRRLNAPRMIKIDYVEELPEVPLLSDPYVKILAQELPIPPLLRLHYVDGFSYGDLARMTGTCEGNIKGRIHRMKKRVRFGDRRRKKPL